MSDLLRCAIYARVSGKIQEDNASLPTQEEACRKYAASQGWEVVRVFREVHTGGDLRRPQLDELRNDIRDGQYDVFLAYSTDRWSRDQMHTALLFGELKDNGVKLDFVTETFDDTPIGRMILNFYAFAAELEREKIRERMTRGRDAVINSGRPLFLGPVPYGYAALKDEGRFEIQEDEAPAIRLMFRLKDEGMSLRALAKELDRLRIPAPSVLRHTKGSANRGWSAQSVGAILKNPIYKGWTVYRRTVTENKKQLKNDPENWTYLDTEGLISPVIISPEQWDRVNKKLSQKDSSQTRNQTVFALMRGLCECGECGRKMWAETEKGRVWRFACRDIISSHPNHGNCSGTAITTRKLDPMVIETMANLFKDPEAEIERARSQMRVGPDPLLNSERQQLVKLIEEKEQYVSSLLRELGNVTSDRVRQRLHAEITQTDEQIEQASIRLDEINTTLVKQKESMDQLDAYVEMIRSIEFKEEWRQLPPEVQRDYLLALDVRAIVYADRVEIAAASSVTSERRVVSEVRSLTKTSSISCHTTDFQIRWVIPA